MSKDDDWARPGSWRGRASDDSVLDKRSGHTPFAEFGPAPHSSRQLDALDLAVPRPSPKDHAAQSPKEHRFEALDRPEPKATPAHGGMPTPQGVRDAMMAHSGTHMLDAHSLAKAVGKDHSFAKRIEKKMADNQSMQRDFTHQMMSHVEKHGWESLHTASQSAAKNLVGAKLSAFKAKNK
jgi:hypothetical protein